MARGSLVTPVWRPNTEGGLDDDVRLRQRLVDRAGIELALEGEVVAELRVDHRRRGVERRLGVGDGRKLLVDDLDALAGILGLGPRARHDGADRFALPAGTLDRQRILRGRFQAHEMRQHADPRGHHRCKLGAGDDRDTTPGDCLAALVSIETMRA